MRKKNNSLTKFIYLSFAFHGLIFLLLTVKIVFFPTETPDHQQSVRVDVVALPEKHIQKPKKIPIKPKVVAKKEVVKTTVPKPPKPSKVTKPKAKKAPKVNLNKKKVKEEQNSAIARLKALQKLKDKKNKLEAAAQKKFKGNSISKGNSLTGLEKLHHDSYLDDLDSHIRSFWNLPEWLADGNLKSSVLLLINKNGGIKGKTFITRSGNNLFDEHILSTLEKASPLPPPPPGLATFYATKGVEIRFPE